MGSLFFLIGIWNVRGDWDWEWVGFLLDGMGGEGKGIFGEKIGNRGGGKGGEG